MAIRLTPNDSCHNRVPVVGDALGLAGWTGDRVPDPVAGGLKWGWERLGDVDAVHLHRDVCAERVISDDLAALEEVTDWLGPSVMQELFEVGIAPIGHVGSSVLYASLVGSAVVAKRGEDVSLIGPPRGGGSPTTLSGDRGWSGLSALRARQLLWAGLLQGLLTLDDVPAVRVERAEVSELVDGTAIARALVRRNLAAARYLKTTYGGAVLDRMAEGLLPLVRDADLILLGGDRAVCLSYVHGYGIEAAQSDERRRALDPWAVHALRQLRTVDSLRWGGNDKHYEPPCDWEELERAVMASNEVPTDDLEMKDVA